MSVYIGKYYPRTKKSVEVDGTIQVLVHPGRNNRYSPLSPYSIKNDKMQLVENAYQFRKIYPKVYAQDQWSFVEGHQGKQQTWRYSEEVHMRNGEPTDEYWIWRENGLSHQFAIRYPNGFKGRHSCHALIDDDGNFLNYIDGRQIYIDGYLTSDIKNNYLYQELHNFLNEGLDILILEVDGPDPAVEITEESFITARNSEDYPFGHGWVIGGMLLNLI